MQNAEYIKNLISALGFVPADGKNNVYSKSYALHNGYTIVVDFGAEKIEYAQPIKLGDATTSNFANAENFVVLECVDRLLGKGYKPQNIELEKKYPLGKNEKGKLDILVRDESGSPFLMIECKTFGGEYEKEIVKMLKYGGQLLSYYAQDRAAKYICLYSSHLVKKSIEYKNSIIAIGDAWHGLSSVEDIHGYWNKNFRDNGIFEQDAAPYIIRHKTLTYNELKNLKEDDSGKIFNQIMEILRHNAISDKPNAFNKLLNLFVCKIIDENKNENDALEFQWLETDDNESLQMRLNDLYKHGMWRFLEIDVIDHSESEISSALNGIDDEAQKKLLRNMFRDIRLKKSPNFAFVEVLDNKTFTLNSKIVREIVELLQAYKFRYDQKHEFLGNFFELLLNTSMKQEVGQFFTPVPITRFVISSLPLKEFVQNKIDDKEREALPAVVDYACGSGHFLTEYMSQMQGIIDNKIDISNALPSLKNQFDAWQNAIKFLWAKETVYGIDMDNRLVKTAKVSAFFNGDGEANIVWANGLDDFATSREYRGKLKLAGQFDVLISNPPYSVEAFKTTINDGGKSFSLHKCVNDTSSEIECLFVERMKQLLKAKGWAAVVLPSSILSNGGIHAAAREILLKFFKFRAIVELGSGTFMKTGTSTIILFLERRADNEHANISKAVEKFFVHKNDVTVSGIENAFSKYVSNVYDNMSFDDYLSFVNGHANENMSKHEMFLDYEKEFGDEIYSHAFDVEKEKMLYFLLTYPQEVVLINTGEKQAEKEFLGYEFSERRGHEGMKWLPGGTKLYDREGDTLSPKKANYYIYNAYLGNDVEIDEEMSHNVSCSRMSDFIVYGTKKFNKVVNLRKKSMINVDSRYSRVAIGNLCEFKYGKPLKNEDRRDGKYPVFGSNGIIGEHNEFIVKAPFIVVGRKGSVGKLAYSEKDGYPIDTTFFIDEVESRVELKYLYHMMELLNFGMIHKQTGVPGVNRNDIYGQKIPLPPLDVQRKIVAEIEAVENKESRVSASIQKARDAVNSIVDSCFSSKYKMVKLDDIAEIFNGGTPSTTNQSYWNGGIKWATLVDTKEKYLYETQRTISEAGLNSCNATLLPKHTVLFSSRATIGDVSIAMTEVATNQGYKNFVCKEESLLYEYLYYVLKHETEAIEDLASGMTYPEISKATISDFKIPLPSLDVQREIVDRIEKHESEIAKLKEKLSELKSSKDDVLKKYL